VGAIARQVSKQATLGFQDAVRAESRKKDPDSENGDGQVLAALGETADTTLLATPWVLWGLLVLVLAAFGLSGYLLIQRRRDRRKTLAASEAIAIEDAGSASEVRDRIQRALAKS
jgi:hypothetical protein